MKLLLAITTLFCGSLSHAADISWVGKPDCRIAGNARVAGHAVYWSGACQDGYASGPGAVQWSLNGKATERYEGSLIQGMPQGPGIMQWEDGSLHEGTFLDGALQGPGLIVSADKSKLRATFAHGEPVGDVTLVDKHGTRYEGGWKDAPEGSGSMTFPLGGVYRGQWHEGRPFGEGEILYPNGQVLKGQFKGSFQLTQSEQPAVTERRYSLKNKEAALGSNIIKDFVSNLPVSPEKPYAGLPADEQRIIRNRYNILQDDDVPPYPQKGMAEVMHAMGALIRYKGETGSLRAIVSIDENGAPQSVDFIEVPSKQASEIAGAIFLSMKYTPGRCAGQPCALKVPFNFKLTFNP